MPPAATATGVVTTTPDGAEDGHTSSTTPGPSRARSGLRMPERSATTDEPHGPAFEHRNPLPGRNKGGANTKQGDLPHATSTQGLLP